MSTTCGLLAASLTACGAAGGHVAHRSHTHTSPPATTRTAGVSGAPSTPAADSPSTADQKRVLAAAYRTMLHSQGGACLHLHAPFGCSPGATDVVRYDVEKLWNEGIDGAGTTIALIEGWPDPRIATQIDRWDAGMGLPDPQIRTVLGPGATTRSGSCPPGVVKNDGGCPRWASETYLDVRSAHLMAPYAKILIEVTPTTSESPAQVAAQGTPAFLAAVEVISAHHLANAISISAFTGEKTFRYRPAGVTGLDPGELAAAAAGIPLVAITGDGGAGDFAPGATRDHGRDVSVFADSPWTLAVGGTELDEGPLIPHLPRMPSGLHFPRLNPGSGAGLSSIYPRPSYQDGVAAQTHSRDRSLPDLTMDGANGTSESGPLMAGVLALATQANGGHDLGPIDPALYGTLGPRGAADGVVDIAQGDDTSPGVRGWSAGPGFDVASGWGTIDAARFVPGLVRATRASDDERSARTRAAADLSGLQRAVHVSASGGAGLSHMTATGFLPLFPVTLSIDGHRVATLRADDHGDVQDAIDPSALHLAAGHHTMSLAGELVTVSGAFTTG